MCRKFVLASTLERIEGRLNARLDSNSIESSGKESKGNVPEAEEEYSYPELVLG